MSHFVDLLMADPCLSHICLGNMFAKLIDIRNLEGTEHCCSDVVTDDLHIDMT